MAARNDQCKSPTDAGRAVLALTRKSASTDTWHVYIVRCADTTLYTGVTNDLQARVRAHNAGKGAKYTRSRRPARLVWRLRCQSRGEALLRGHAIKRLTRR